MLCFLGGKVRQSDEYAIPEIYDSQLSQQQRRLYADLEKKKLYIFNKFYELKKKKIVTTKIFLRPN